MRFRVLLSGTKVQLPRLQQKTIFRYFNPCYLIMDPGIKYGLSVNRQIFGQVHIIGVCPQAFHPEGLYDNVA